MMGTIEQILGYFEICCGVMFVIILLIVAVITYSIYKRMTSRPPKRAKSEWERNIWESMRTACELMDMNATFKIETDEDSPDFKKSYKCIGVMNYFSWITILLLKEYGVVPKMEILMADPEIVSGIGSTEIKLYANGIDNYGIYKKPVYRKNEKDRVGEFDEKIQVWYAYMVENQLTPLIISKGAEQTVGVMEIDPNKSSMIAKFLERTAGFESKGESND